MGPLPVYAGVYCCVVMKNLGVAKIAKIGITNNKNLGGNNDGNNNSLNSNYV